jgi:ubiquinone/menaquinone biosynthesis C-methylase UbiE
MKLKQTAPFEANAERYDCWYDEHEVVFKSEVNAIGELLRKLPENIHGIEVGLGTGRFATALGIQEGIEPADSLRQMAMDRGLEVMDARAERLPYGDLQFDFVLFVTICYLEDLARAFGEAFRVLKDGGAVLVGILDRERPIAQSYINRRENSVFYRTAHFYSAGLVTKKLKEAGFRDFEYVQTLFGDLDDIDEVQEVREGHGEGGFVVVKATKKA